jgi:radical SAM superfamily enzyme YgiQ (UPF0313 family)
MRIVFPTLHVRDSAQATPLAAACLAAMVHDRPEYDCILLNLFADEPIAKIVDRILNKSPDLIVIPLYTWNHATMLAVSREIRKQAPALTILGGGPEATADAAGIITEGELDGAIRGEGEETFVAVLETLREQKPLSLIPGLSLRQDGQVGDGPDRPPCDPEKLPSPWLSGVLTPPKGGGLLWEVARGCRFDCSYCFDSLGSQSVSKLPEERLAAELELFNAAGVSQVWALDSTFNFPAERGKRLLQLLAGYAEDIHFHLEAKVDYLDEEMIQMLALIPCSIQIGLQSFHPQVLRAIHRSLDVESSVEKIRQMAEAGITYGFDLIYGLPGDDLDGFRSSLELALSLRPNQVDIFPLAVLPGTRLFEQKGEYQMVAAETAPYEIVQSDTWTTDTLEKARLLAAATDLFYNLGRAVGFFDALTRITNKRPISFLEGFADWILLHQGVYRSVLIDIGCWRPEEILPMQEGYVQFLLLRDHHESILQAALDLIRYHFHYAETLLEEDLQPAEDFDAENLWQRKWRRSPRIRLVPFYYEILDLLEMEEIDLEAFADLFRPVGSVALFCRRDGEVLCESMEEDFLTLLRNCDGKQTPEEIFAGSVSRNAGEEIVQFAAAEGFILPVN